jgi:hypothetical protein
VNVIGRHFSRPLEARHGAYTASLIARGIGAPVAVMPHKAPPLEDQFGLELCRDDRLLSLTAVNARALSGGGHNSSALGAKTYERKQMMGIRCADNANQTCIHKPAPNLGPRQSGAGRAPPPRAAD